MSQELRIFWFDAVRGVSALAVCAGHLRAAFFCDYGEISKREGWHVPFYFATGLGHQAVMVFFVLSGYFVGGSVLRKRSNFSWSNYSIARLSRLWTVLLPALVFTAIIDFAIWRLAPAALQGEYYDRWTSGPTSGSYDAGLFTFLCNSAFLQTIISPVYGTNSPLWSLANEFWYYALFPLLVAIVYPKLRFASLAYCIVAAAIILALPTSIVYAGVIWVLGAVVYCLRDYKSFAMFGRPWIAISLSCAAFAASLVNSKYHFLDRYLPVFISHDFAVGLSFAVLAFLLVAASSKSLSLLERPVRWLSDVSYSLYLFHFPMIVFIVAVFYGGRQYQPTIGAMCMYCLWLVSIVLACHAAWWLFERNTDYVRECLSWMCQTVSIRKSNAMQAASPSSRGGADAALGDRVAERQEG